MAKRQQTKVNPVTGQEYTVVTPRTRSLGKSKPKAQSWEDHRGQEALDPWGTAIRDMKRKLGYSEE